MKDKVSLDTPYYSYYIIEEGDTLYKIGKKYDFNPKLIAELNGLKYDDYIYPSQVLILPKKGVQYYISKDGDSVGTVSSLFNTTEEELIDQNKTIYLLPGQMIFYKEK